MIYLAALGIAMGLMTLVWIVSLFKRDVSIIDIFWGFGFVVLAWFYLLATDGETLRRVLVTTLVTVWGMRLSLYLLWRNWGEPEDYRYAEMREKHPESFPARSLFTIFWLQAVLLWAISVPILQGQRASTELTPFDYLGLAFFAVGFTFEAVGDYQLARFKADPENQGRVMDRGLWRYTRHPNYFGDAMVWWGFFMFAASTPGSLWTIYSPLLMTALLMKVSGVALLERNLKDKKPEYREYIEKTSAFVPWFRKP